MRHGNEPNPISTRTVDAEFLKRYGTEAQCAAALEQTRWPTGLRCPHHKLMQAMAEREARYVLDGQVQVDDAYVGGERSGGKVGQGSANMVPFVGAVSLSDEGHPLRTKLTPGSGFSLNAIRHWAQRHLAPGSTVFSDGLACFTAVTTADRAHQPTVVGERKPRVLPELQWINTALGNLRISLCGNYHAFNFRKYAARYLDAFAYRFNRRFDLRYLRTRLLAA